MKQKFFLLLLCLIIFLPFTSIRAQDNNEQTHKGTFFRISDDVEINQKIDGDVMVIARNLKINSSIMGDVLAIAENIEINGDIDGNIRAIAKNITINSKISRNITVISVETKLKENTLLEKDIFILSRKFKNEGVIKGSITGELENVELKNLIEGDVNINLSKNGNLAIHPQTTIKGNLNYTAEKQITVPNGATINGRITYNPPKKTDENAAFNIFVFNKIIALFGMIALGMAVLVIDKKNTMKAILEIRKNPNKSILWGALYFFAIPLCSILLLFTIIGVPLALILAALYLILLYVSQVFVGIAIGSALFAKKKVNDIWAMSIGLIVFVVITSIPYIGAPLKLLSIFIGMGAIINAKKKMLKQDNRLVA